MSGSDKTLYIFVKGNKALGAYCITDIAGNRIQEDQFFEFEQGNQCNSFPECAELKVMFEALKFIEKNRNLTPSNLNIFTNSENVYLIARSHIMPEFSKKMHEHYKGLKESLLKNGKANKISEYWIPKKFHNELDRLLGSLESYKKTNKKTVEKIFRKGI